MSECVTFPTDRPSLEGSVPFSLDQGLLPWGGGSLYWGRWEPGGGTISGPAGNLAKATVRFSL